MSNNFRKTAVLKKKNDLRNKATKQRVVLKNFGGVPVLFSRDFLQTFKI